MRAGSRGSVATGRAAGLLLGVLADAVLGDPARWHPVAGFGRLAQQLEQRMHRDDRQAGAAFLLLCVGPPIAASRQLERRAAATGPITHASLVAVTVWAACGARQLGQAARQVHDRLERDDVEGARLLMPTLVGRDPSSLDPAGMVRATVESVAENTSDATIGPIFWALLAGVPGILAHRMVNTLDAMVGHRTPRHRNFGTASARADDVLGYLPARLTAALHVVSAPLIGGRSRDALAAWTHDARLHPSPNAGPVEASAAGALGRTFGGTVTYGGRTEDRGLLGTGPAPQVEDIPRAVALSRLVTAGAVLLATSAGILLREGRGAKR